MATIPPPAILAGSAEGSGTPSTEASKQLEQPAAQVEVVRDHDDKGPPDGGLRAWLVVLGGFLNFAIAFGMMNAFGTYQPIYQAQWHADSSTVSWIGATQMFLTFLGGLVFGPAFDRFGARAIMIPGTIMCLLSFIAQSFSTKFFHFLLAQGVLFGLGNAMLFYPATSSISEWFSNKRALALGMALSGASAGGMFWPLIVSKLFKAVPQPWVYRILAAISIPLLLVSCVLIKERKAKSGLSAPATTDSTDCDTILNESESEQMIKSSKWAIIGEPRFLALCAALFFIYGGMLIPFFYIPLFAMEHGINHTLANNLPAIGYGIGILGRVMSGWLADRVGRFNVLIVIATATSIVTYTWVASISYATMVASTIAFCVFSGGLIPLGSACVGQTTENMQYIGLRIRAKMTMCAFAALGGAPLSGYIKDNGGDWFGCYAFSASGTLLGAIILVAVRFWNQPKVFVVV
ncbi:putative transporter [Escovopsis weberi]|uniref:Putative transporter n=1 Tax=Escovopsis weberi TaxID=150374 RepID=A0A0M9VX29_ESCWE|nr:putative transporter [Escovopsis weberi]